MALYRNNETLNYVENTHCLYQLQYVLIAASDNGLYIGLNAFEHKATCVTSRLPTNNANAKVNLPQLAYTMDFHPPGDTPLSKSMLTHCRSSIKIQWTLHEIISNIHNTIVTDTYVLATSNRCLHCRPGPETDRCCQCQTGSYGTLRVGPEPNRGWPGAVGFRLAPVRFWYIVLYCQVI